MLQRCMSQKFVTVGTYPYFVACYLITFSYVYEYPLK